MQMLTPRGELRKRAHQHSIMVDAVKLADGVEAEFVDMNVMTLKQWLKEKSYDEAWNFVAQISDVDEYAEKLRETKYSSGKEFVQFGEEGILVVLNVDEIDDKAIDKALMHLASSTSVEHFGEHRVFEFGEEITPNP
jgi:hypothetical protein